MKGKKQVVTEHELGFSHNVLDVFSVKQGALRIAVMPLASLLCLFVGIYFCISAVLSPQPSTLNPLPQPYTLNPAPSTLNPALHTVNRRLSSLRPEP